MINYKYVNNKSNCCLLFVHGWNVDSSSLYPLIESIKKEFSYLYLDLCGFGNSKMEKAYHIDDYCHDINEIVVREKINNLYGIGHSFGGKILLRYSEIYEINGLLLIAPSIYKPRYSIRNKIKVITYKCLKKMNLRIPRSLKGSRDFINSKGELRKTFLNVYSYYFSKKRLKNNQINSFIVGFSEDREISKKQLLKIKKYLPNSELYIYNGNHFGYLKKIKEIRVIISYLTSTR